MENRQTVELIFGTAQLVNSYGITRETEHQRDPDEASEFLAYVEQVGIKTIDTAPAYGDAELVIGSTGIPFSIHTKLGHGLNARASLINSKIALCTESIDVMYVHNIEEFREDSSKIVRELAPLLEVGVGAIGVSIYEESDWDLVRQYEEINVVQVPMNIFDQRFAGDVLDEIRQSDRRCIVRSVFLQGVLLATPQNLRPEVHHLRPYIEEFNLQIDAEGINAVSACLSWVAAQEGVSGIIVGAQNPQELSGIIGAWADLSSTAENPSWTESLMIPSWDQTDPRKWN